MKKFLLILLAAACIPAAAQTRNEPQITNGDFELWTIDGVNLPNYFNSFQTADGNSTYVGYAYNSSNRQVGRSSETRPGSTGQYSCNIWARKISVMFGLITTIAQGNLTTGRVHCGATSADDPQNNNYSDRDGYVTFGSFRNPCAMPFTGRPDSLAVWIKYTPESSSTKAKISTVLHDDFDYHDHYKNAYASDSHVIATAINNDIDTKGGAWQRVVIPFTYYQNDKNPNYILFSIATSSVPGVGGAYDSLLLDDIELIYNHSYQLTVPSQGWASLCVDFNANIPAGAKVFYATGMVAGYVKLQEIPSGSVIPANTPVLVQAPQGTLLFEENKGAATASVSGNILKGSVTAGSVVSGKKYYVLSPASTPDKAVFGLYKGTSLAANKAYIAVP